MAGPVLSRVVKDFKCAATGDQTIQLNSLRGKKVVLYFYPKDATPGCTTEGQDFRDLHARFKEQNAIILGASRDSITSHEKFREKQKFPFDLLSDTDEKTLQAVRCHPRKDTLWPQIHGYRTQYFSDRRNRKTAQGMAKGQGEGPCD